LSIPEAARCVGRDVKAVHGPCSTPARSIVPERRPVSLRRRARRLHADQGRLSGGGFHAASSDAGIRSRLSRPAAGGTSVFQREAPCERDVLPPERRNVASDFRRLRDAGNGLFAVAGVPRDSGADE
jgi:hypothetical protein